MDPPGSPMLFRFKCPHCGGKLKLPTEWHGRRVRCPKCDRPFDAPPDPAGGAAPPPADDEVFTAEVAEPVAAEPVEPPRPARPPRPRPRREPEPPTGWWQKAKTGFKWYVRVMAVLVVGNVVVGWLQVWSVPSVARKAEVEVFDMLLRCVEHSTEHPIDPFYVLGANPRIEAGVVALTGTMDTAEKVETAKKGQYEHAHTVRMRDKSTRVVKATTPHLTVPADDLRKARRAVEAMYAPGEKAEWDALGAWATGLWRLNWYRRNSPGDVPAKAIPEPRDGTDEERLWLVWQVLAAGQPQAERDLARLPALLREAYPADADREAALVWARTLHRRLRDNAADHQKTHTVESGRDELDHQLRAHATWVPPETEVTLAWLLYQHVGLNDDSRKAARDRWLSYFPPRKADRVLAFGKRVEAERRAAGEPLPPTGDNVALLCVVERFVGTDGYGERARAAYRERWPNRFRSMLAGYVMSLYPADDLFYVVTSGDRLELFSDMRAAPFIAVFLILMVGYGFRFVILTGLGEGLLKLGDDPKFQKYVAGGGRRSGWVSRVLAFGVVPVVGWFAALATLSPQLDLLVTSPFHLFLGVYLAVLLGGTLVGVPSRLVAVVLIKLGVDVEKTWLDEVLGVAVGALILGHFGNDAVSIAVYALYELLPTAAGRARRWFATPTEAEAHDAE